MSSIQSEVTTLIETLKRQDPRTYQALTLLNKKIEDLRQDLEPIIRQSSILAPVTTDAISPPGNFTVSTTGTTVRFTWSAVTGAANYEIRKGTVWDTANFVTRTPNLQADIDPLLYGAHNYLIKTLNSSGSYSELFSQVNIIISQIPAPTISKIVIDNNVLLTWTAPTSAFNLKHYILKKDGVETGKTTSTFTTFFEVVNGLYSYSITAVDIAGNVGIAGLISVQVTAPPDFALSNSRISVLGGTRVNVILTASKLLASWASETYDSHFVSRAWVSIQAKLNAGYTLYIEPTTLTGSYEEVIDYGTVLNNVIVAITYSSNQVKGTTTTVIKMAVSSDNISYTSFVSGAVQFYASFRFLKFRLEFTGANDKSLLEVFNIKIEIQVKRENDGGEVSAVSTDVGGTNVTFNKAFKDVETITATVKSTTEPFITIIKFNDIPSPPNFQVFVFDTTGNRVSKTVEWKARGIL